MFAPGNFKRRVPKDNLEHQVIFKWQEKTVIKKLAKEMAECAKRHEFEKAGSIKKTIFSLKHIHDVSLIKTRFKLCRLGGRKN